MLIVIPQPKGTDVFVPGCTSGGGDTELKVYRCGNNLWQMFQQYHYLNGSLGAGVRCYTAIYQNKPIAFIAVACTRMKAKYYLVSLLVVLPDYQGIGIGKRLLNFIAELYSIQTHQPFYILTSNPQLLEET